MDIKITKITRPSEEKTFGNSEQLSMNRLFTMLDEPNFYIMHSKIIICTLTISNYLGSIWVGVGQFCKINTNFLDIDKHNTYNFG